MNNARSNIKIAAWTNILFLGLLPVEGALAQSNVVPDDTLGPNQSGVISLDASGFPVDVINGGLASGSNLFHSFSEFNVSAGQGVYFFNPSNDIANILSRVTGGTRSEILGTLGIANAAGVSSQPNLIFLNPNGILFGPNASLDLPATFIATTADAVQLGQFGLFDAVNPDNSTLLSVDPSALLFGQGPNSPIVNQASTGLAIAGRIHPVSTPRLILTNGQAIPIPSGLQVADGQSLLLIGGDILLDQSSLSSVGGSIDVGSIQSSSRVDLVPTVEGFRADYSDVTEFGNITLSTALLNASGVNSGRIQLQANRISNYSGLKK
jgi:filamentous hemagglutinin family protein